MAQFRRVKKAAAIAGTFAFALSIGYVMQYGDADASRFAGTTPILERTVLPAQLDASPLQQAVAMHPKIPAPIQLSENPFDTIRVDPGSVKLTALVAEAAREAASDTASLPVSGNVGEARLCDIATASAVGPQASLLVSVQSDCRPNMAFEVVHEGMVFSAMTDQSGRGFFEVPALTTDASVFLKFEDGAGTVASKDVPEAASFHRIVLQWEGPPTALIQQIRLDAEARGSLTRLGEVTGSTDRFAEVVTFPNALPIGDGLQDLTVQAPVLDATCGTEFLATTFHVMPGTDPDFKDIRITLPDCDHVGTFLELKKVLGGQTLLPE